MTSSKNGIGTRIAAGLVALVAVTLMSGVTAVASDNVVDRIVAQVNDEIITLYDLEEAALPYLVQYGQDPRVLEDDDQREQILDDVLDDKIDSILVEQEAREMGLEVAQAQIDEWIEMTAQQQGMTRQQFQQAIAQYGIDYEQYEDIIRDNLLRMQLMQQRPGGGGQVSEAEVDDAYHERFGDPEEGREFIEVRHILLVPDELDGGEQEARQQAQQLREQIIDGEARFDELADTYSQGPGAGDGGNIGTFSRGDLAESFEEVAFAQQVGEVSEPVQTEFGIHLIEVLDRDHRADPQVEQRRQQIQAELQEQQMEEQMESFLETLRTRAFLDIRY